MPLNVGENGRARVPNVESRWNSEVPSILTSGAVLPVRLSSVRTASVTDRCGSSRNQPHNFSGFSWSWNRLQPLTTGMVSPTERIPQIVTLPTWKSLSPSGQGITLDTDTLLKIVVFYVMLQVSHVPSPVKPYLPSRMVCFALVTHSLKKSAR